ncbi:MAG TPA: YMGG-like glycine zipper-containing protein [Pyrinomonadaceae bacterium]|nr:YMGG-like glycine zipper-containing protein [Pyrinomonadaceae bacterium]
MRRISAFLILALLVGALAVVAPAQTQRRRQQQRRTPPAISQRTAAATPADSRLTGLYRLDPESSDDPQEAAERSVQNLAFGIDASDMDRLTRRLSSPPQLAIERRGTTISIASTRAERITFEADGKEKVERTAQGREVRSRAVLYNEELMVSYADGERDEFNVTFDPFDEGRRLRVTRRIYDRRLQRPVVVQSIYEKVSTVARWDVYGGPDSAQVAMRERPARQLPPAQGAGVNNRTQPQPPPVARNPQPVPTFPETRDTAPVLMDQTQFVAVLNNDLSTGDARPGDPFTMTVREPRAFAGATIEGYVSRVSPGGRVSGRSEMALAFERLILPDGRALEISGYLESIQPAQGGERVRIDSEGGGISERDNRSSRTVQRTAIGAAIGAIIGAIADEGRGAAIGAAVGAAAGAGSVYVEGRDDLELRSGTEVTLRASMRQ